MPAVLGEPTVGDPADRAGLRSGDRVVKADGEAVSNWQELVEIIRSRPGKTIEVEVERATGLAVLDVQVATVTEAGESIGRIGVGPDIEQRREAYARFAAEQHYGPLQAFSQAMAQTWKMSALTVKMLGRMVIGDVSFKNLSGPINIASYAGDSAQAGWGAFVRFLALISISLGIINLLPIPLLDGGQIVYQIVELVKGSPLSERALLVGQQVGIFFLLVIMSFAFYNDIARLFAQ